MKRAFCLLLICLTVTALFTQWPVPAVRTYARQSFPVFLPLITNTYPLPPQPPQPSYKIAFASQVDGNYELYLVNPDGSGLQRLTDHPGSDTSPAWSPDGSRIAFVYNWNGYDDIYVMNPDGSGLVQITADADWKFNLSWSPDGQKFRYQANNEEHDNGSIFVIDTDGSNRVQLTDWSMELYSPAWSPDGSRIAFLMDNPNVPELEIYMMNADGSGVTQLTDDELGKGSLAWSPDGSQIAYTFHPASYCSAPSGSCYQIGLINVDGSGFRQLTYYNADHWDLDWSPDGAYLAYASDRDGDFEIFVQNVASGESVQLTHNEAFDFDPSWSPIKFP
jgi:TolB protein